jgi:hypothetical protein
VQVIFSDIAVNDENGNFSAYKYIRDELVDKKIPAKEIIFAPKADSKDRADIFAKINSGQYRVVIASTGTLGTGANIQQNLKALHHIDVPWKPSDFQQREGRILRQGNENKEVEIYNYITKGTLDSYLYATVTNKAKFIAQLLDNEAPARVCEDCDEKVLTFSEIQAAASGRPEIQQHITKSNELATLRSIKVDYNFETSQMKRVVEKIPQQIEKLETKLANIQIDRDNASKINEISIGGKREQACEELIRTALERSVLNIHNEIYEPVKIGNIESFEIFAEAYMPLKKNFADIPTPQCNFVVKGAEEYRFEAGFSLTARNIQRLENFFGSEGILKKREDNTALEISKLKTDLSQAQERVNKPFERDEEIKKLEIEIEELSRILSKGNNEIISDGEEFVETPEEKSEREKIYKTDESDLQPVPELKPENENKNRRKL